MNKKAFTLVEIMIAAGIVALLSSIAIPNVLRARVASNETFARATLKSLSTASETYMLILGSYPGNITSLTSASPPYINQSFCGISICLYFFSCKLSCSSFTCCFWENRNNNVHYSHWRRIVTIIL